MQAVVYAKYGDSEVLELVEKPIPTPKPKQVLLKVHAASINPGDWKVMKGLMSFLPAFIMPPPSKETPRSIGFDVAGEVVHVGSEVTKWKVGDQVFGMSSISNPGAIAEYFAIDEQEIMEKPTNASYVEAASLPMVTTTSCEALITNGNLKKLDRVLILGGSSGTGSIAIQIAKQLGASHVITTCSKKNEDFVQLIGADQVIDYTKEHFAQVLEGQRLDIVYDCVGGRDAYEVSIPLLTPGGQYITIVGDTKMDSPLSIQNILWNTIAVPLTRKVWNYLTGRPSYTMVAATLRLDHLKYIKEQMEKQTIKPMVTKEFPFDLSNIKKAFDLSMSGHAVGKIVIKMH